MDDLHMYFKNTQEPWGKLFYKTLWEQLYFVKGMNVLDFGSGFGITANHLALQNSVTAIEPNEKMCEMRMQENGYKQIVGGLESLNDFPDNHFDIIVCHNVLEYVENKEEYIELFSKKLKKTGIISLVKHNKLGRIMQRVIFENQPELALKELEGQSLKAQNFGEVKYYDDIDIINWSKKFNLSLEKTYGIRTFFGLIQNNQIKYDETWQEKMLNIELATQEINEFKNIAFFNHVLLKK